MLSGRCGSPASGSGGSGSSVVGDQEPSQFVGIKPGNPAKIGCTAHQHLDVAPVPAAPVPATHTCHDRSDVTDAHADRTAGRTAGPIVTGTTRGRRRDLLRDAGRRMGASRRPPCRHRAGIPLDSDGAGRDSTSRPARRGFSRRTRSGVRRPRNRLRRDAGRAALHQWHSCRTLPSGRDRGPPFISADVGVHRGQASRTS